ncbi:MAG TPA: phosphotransferase [Phenylobacterium sp.]|nr:phosphotransferase [Phenylobacterium sp.]
MPWSFPETRRPAIDRALIAAFGTAELDSVVPMTGGLSGALVYKIRVGGIAYLLRVEGAADLFSDPARWYGAMRIAAEACLAPRVRYADVEDRVAIMDFIPELSLALDYAGTRRDMIVELAQAVRALHAAPPFPPMMDYLDGMEILLGQLRAGGLVAAQALAQPLDRYAELAAVYRRLPADLVSSHNDLNPRNLLYDGSRLWLVDWESSFLADRWVDLATLANFFTSGPAEEEALLATYFGETPDAARRARMFLARQINHVFYAAIFLNGAAAERPGARLPGDRLEAPPVADLHRRLGEGEPMFETWEGRVAYGQARLIQASENLAGPDCARAIAALAA